MKTIIKYIAFLPIIVASLSGCSSTRGYFVDRGRDSMDIVSASAGFGAGAQIQAGPVPFGLLETSDVTGLRYGDLFLNRPSMERAEEKTTSLSAVAGVAFVPVVFIAGTYGGVLKPDYEYWRSVAESLDHRNEYPMNDTQWCRNKSAKGPSSASFYQTEAVLGMGLVVRAGVNVGELVDFLIGWTTIDIFDDDIELKSISSATADTMPGALKQTT
jgi:hypothetical protein